MGVSGMVFRRARSRLNRSQLLLVKLLVGKLSPRSTQCTPFHRSRGIRSNLNFFVKHRQNVFAIELMNFINSIAKKIEFCIFSTNF